MEKVTTVGIDLAKSVFSLNGVDGSGRTVLRRTVRRDRLVETVAALPPCLIGMEACSGAHEWGRRFQQHGHTVKLMAPGGKPRLGHISKRGDAYLRNLLVQGARSVLHTAEGRADRISRWALPLQERRGYHRTLVAIANKNARVAWALLAHNTEFRAA